MNDPGESPDSATSLSIEVTGDGSHTVRSESFQATYHSVHGALNESRHVFIRSGLEPYIDLHPAKPVRIIEIGLGTGLNCLLAMLLTRLKGIPLYYTGTELYPLSSDVVRRLNYPHALSLDPHDETLFQRFHLEEAFSTNGTAHFHFRKWVGDFLEYLDGEVFDVVFHDAFAPEVQPELWDEACFNKIYALTLPGAVLVTYCAKGVVRRTLERCGFKVDRLPGPPGKREMIYAVRL